MSDEQTIVEVNAEMVDQLQTQVEAIATLHTDIEASEARNLELTAQVAKSANEVEELQAIHADAIASVEAISLERDALAARNADQANALLHPAYVDAVTGTEPTDNGGESSDELSITEQFSNISEPAERSAFYRENATAIKAGK